MVAGLGVRHQAFRARRRPLDGAPEEAGGPGDGRDLDREMHLEPEAAADVGRDHPDPVLGHEQRVVGEPAAQVVGRLGRGVERVAAGGGLEVAQVAARLHRVAGDPVGRQRHLDHVAGVAERRLGGGAVALLDLEHEVGAEALVHARGVGVERARDVGHRGKRRVVDGDALGRVERRVAGLGDDGGDDVADMADRVRGEGRARGLVHRPPVAERHRMDDGELAEPRRLPVAVVEDAEHAVEPPGLRRIDPFDAGMGVRRPHEGAPRHAGQRHVVDIAPAPAEEARILAARERLADIAHEGARAGRPKSAARADGLSWGGGTGDPAAFGPR